MRHRQKELDDLFNSALEKIIRRVQFQLSFPIRPEYNRIWQKTRAYYIIAKKT